MHADAFTSLQVELLERTAYSVRDPVRAHALGITLERQRGVHAIGSDRRADFDTWPGVLAYTPPGVEVFSESASGGEYLVVRWTSDAYAETAINANERVQWTGSSQALQAAHALRRLLLARERDTLAIEQAALTFMNVKRQKAVIPSPNMRATYARVLDRIVSEFDQPLTIAQLALSEGRTPLNFLREFTRMVGMTPHAFIIETRVQAARALMKRNAASLAAIAADCGFAHQSHMGTAFRKVLGQTPGQYRSALPASDALHRQMQFPPEPLA